MSITIVGLGPGDASLLTREALEILEGAHEVYLRTRRHPTVASLPTHLRVHSFDSLYESEEEFAGVYEKIAAQEAQVRVAEQSSQIASAEPFEAVLLPQAAIADGLARR